MQGCLRTAAAHLSTNAAVLATSLAKTRENPAKFQAGAPGESNKLLPIGASRSPFAETINFIFNGLSERLSYSPAIALSSGVL